MAIFSTLFIRRLGLLAGLLFGLIATAWAQAPAWQNVVTAAPTNSNSGSEVSASVIDASGNVYVAGSFVGSINIGGVVLTSTGAHNIFVAKWSSATQSIAWAQQSSGTGHKAVTSLAVSSNRVYVAGYFMSTAVFGNTTISSSSLADSDGFVAKLTDAGSSASFAWAQQIGGTGIGQVTALAANGTAIYATGSFTDIATFGGTTYANTSFNAFLTKLTDAGSSSTFTWVQVVGGHNAAQAGGVAVQGTNVYFTGVFSGTTAFGSISLTSVSTNRDVFVAKLSDAGSSPTYTWVQQVNGAGYLEAKALVVQGTQVYVAGRFQGVIHFGTISLAGVNTIGGLSDVFVAKLTDAGTTAGFVWANWAGGPEDDDLTALAVQGSSVYIGGSFGSTASFGSTTLTTTGYDAFVAKLLDAGSSAPFAWAKGVSSPSFSRVQTLASTSTAVYVGGIFSSGAATFGSQTVTSASTSYTGFFTALVDATGLATAIATVASAKVTAFPTPTPSGTVVTVQLPTTTNASFASLTLLDAVGRVIQTTTIPLAPSSPQVTLTVPLAPGVYALRVAAGETLSTARLVVE